MIHTTIDILAIANHIIKKYAFKYDLPWQTLYGPAYEAVLAAQKSWRPGGKSLESWAEGYLRAIIRREMGHHKALKAKARYISLDDVAYDGDGEGMSNHELVGDWSGVEEIEEGLECKETTRTIKEMSPRLQAVADMLVGQGCTLTETGKKLGNYTPARVKQLQGKIAAGLRGEVAEGPQLRLF